jgi:membrane protein implicated in regulation of membrane protease activity
MAGALLNTAARARALVYTLLVTFFALIMTIVTVRFASGGDDWFELTLLTAITLLLWWQVRRWFRIFRARGADQSTR